MSDILFKCVHCSMKLVADESFMATNIACPNCQKECAVPQPSITFKCPSCNKVLSAPAQEGGEVYTCSSCGTNVTVPVQKPGLAPLKPLQKRADPPPPGPATVAPAPRFAPPPTQQSSLTVDKNTPSPVSEPEPVTETPVSESPPATGEPEPTGSRLKFKAVTPTDPSSNPAMERYALPQYSVWEHVKPVLKKVAVGLAVPVAAVAALFFVDLGKPEGKSWSTAVQALDTLKKMPTDVTALTSIKGVLAKVDDGMTGRTPKAALMTIWALGQIHLGHVEKGLAACQWIQNNYSDTRFAEACSRGNFTQNCPECEGNQPPCPQCRGNVTCRACAGKGRFDCSACQGKGSKTFSTTMKTEGSKGIKRLGGSGSQNSGGGITTTTCTACKGTGKLVCTVCKGTGKCQTCKGTGKALTNCVKCDGRGWVVNKPALYSHYTGVIDKARRFILGKMILERLSDIGIRFQAIMKRTKSQAETTPPTVQPEQIPDIDFERPGETNKVVDWEKRYKDLYQEYADKFTAPQTNQPILIRVDGRTYAGVVASLTESNIEIRSTNMNVTVGFDKKQLDAESRAKCFREDFAAFNARNKCDEEKTKSSPPEKP